MKKATPNSRRYAPLVGFIPSPRTICKGSGSSKLCLEAPSGFEPLHRSFADCSLSHLGTAPHEEQTAHYSGRWKLNSTAACDRRWISAMEELGFRGDSCWSIPRKRKTDSRQREPDHARNPEAERFPHDLVLLSLWPSLRLQQSRSPSGLPWALFDPACPS